MDWFKKHADTVIVIGAIISSMLWMNGKFGDIEREMAVIKQEIALIKTVLVMRGIMPQELANKD
jgi:hypothetical protein